MAKQLKPEYVEKVLAILGKSLPEISAGHGCRSVSQILVRALCKHLKCERPPKLSKNKARSVIIHFVRTGEIKQYVRTPTAQRSRALRQNEALIEGKRVAFKPQNRNEWVKTDEFLSSFDWRKLRMEAIKKYGRTCACCGLDTVAAGIPINIDHIKPRKKYPELALDINNLQPLCGPCNHGKGNWDETDWRTPQMMAA